MLRNSHLSSHEFLSRPEDGGGGGKLLLAGGGGRPVDGNTGVANLPVISNVNMRKIIVRASLALGAVILVWGGWTAVSAWNAWNSVEREEFDTTAARELLETREIPAPSTTTSSLLTDLGYVALDSSTDTAPGDRSELPDAPPPPTTTTTDLPPPPPSKPQPSVDAYLALGIDPGGRADAILLLVRPAGQGPILISVPRSLYITNPCTGEPERVGLTLSGCPGVASGSELLAIALEDFTGLSIDHFARINYEEFPQVVDAVGGVQICVDNARGANGTVIIPAGCNTADGATALWWVANRSEDELVDGEWRALPGDGDASRTGRQRAMMLTLFSKIGSFSSAGSISSVLSSVSGALTLDGSLSLGGAANIAWSMRGQSVQQLSIPTEAAYTADGLYVLYPAESFAATLARVYPPAAAYQP